ncbi:MULTISPECIES: hypothetical protein [unclassified Adlercreutzia]|uniref:hypothetical protein n=1 Tax=unclassified Adlercreutzia TaxID=2636013 RepID=UPI0013ECBA1F|nr:MULTISPECIES: hypothetical protein [unclassified Adlercreutzia]
MSTFNEDYPEFRNVNSGNGSVDRIVQSYAAKDAARARNARMRMQVRASNDIDQDSRRLDWEAQRAIRNAQHGRNTNREIIDGRGSIDSRALNEKNELVGYTIDERDRHDPMVDINDSKSRWRSHDGNFGGYDRMPVSGGKRRNARPNQIGLQGGSMGNKRNFAAASNTGIPLFVKIAIPVIIILIIVLIFLLTP